MVSQNDEIDLLELFAKFIQTVRKNAISIISAFIIGSLLGLAYFQFAPNIYESKMILMSDILTSSYSERITESLDILINEQNAEALSKRLSIAEEEAKDVVKIEIESLNQKNKDNEKNESSIFIVTARTKQNQLLPKLQEGIIRHLQNNEFVKIRVNQRKTYLQTMIDKVGEEISSLDSLKRRLFLGKPIYSKSAEMMLVDPTSIYSKIIDLNKERVNLKNSLELVNSIQLVEGFTLFKKPTSPKLSISVAAGSSLGLFFAALVIGFKSIRRIIQFSEEKLGKN